jgi:hypothetical protein
MSHEEKLNVIQYWLTRKLGSYEAGMEALEMLLSERITHDAIMNARFYKNSRGVGWIKGYLQGLLDVYHAQVEHGRSQGIQMIRTTITEILREAVPTFTQDPIVVKAIRRMKQYRHNLAK